jgi:hypothetical protein
MAFKDPEKSREYHRQYMKAWYQKNKRTQVERNLKRRKKIQAWFSEFKATLHCAKCGENHPACLESHHDDPKAKETTINKAIWQLH